MSSFIDQRTKEIFQNASTDVPPTPSPTANQDSDVESSKGNLKSTLAGLHTPPNDQQLVQGLELLNDRAVESLASLQDPYAIGISERVVAGLYARTMEEMLQQALEADMEARFWWDVERSKYNIAWFLLQSM
jgi:nuclear-control-of-ATPase protein 2